MINYLLPAEIERYGGLKESAGEAETAGNEAVDRAGGGRERDSAVPWRWWRWRSRRLGGMLHLGAVKTYVATHATLLLEVVLGALALVCAAWLVGKLQLIERVYGVFNIVFEKFRPDLWRVPGICAGSPAGDDDGVHGAGGGVVFPVCRWSARTSSRRWMRGSCGCTYVHRRGRGIEETENYFGQVSEEIREDHSERGAGDDAGQHRHSQQLRSICRCARIGDVAGGWGDPDLAE